MVSIRKGDGEDRDDLDEADETDDLDDAEDLDDLDEQDYADDYLPRPAIPGWAVFWNKVHLPLAFFLLAAISLGVWLPLRSALGEPGDLAIVVAGFSALIMFLLLLLARFREADFAPPLEDEESADWNDEDLTGSEGALEGLDTGRGEEDEEGQDGTDLPTPPPKGKPSGKK